MTPTSAKFLVGGQMSWNYIKLRGNGDGISTDKSRASEELLSMLRAKDDSLEKRYGVTLAWDSTLLMLYTMFALTADIQKSTFDNLFSKDSSSTDQAQKIPRYDQIKNTLNVSLGWKIGLKLGPLVLPYLELGMYSGFFKAIVDQPIEPAQTVIKTSNINPKINFYWGFGGAIGASKAMLIFGFKHYLTRKVSDEIVTNYKTIGMKSTFDKVRDVKYGNFALFTTIAMRI